MDYFRDINCVIQATTLLQRCHHWCRRVSHLIDNTRFNAITISFLFLFLFCCRLWGTDSIVPMDSPWPLNPWLHTPFWSTVYYYLSLTMIFPSIISPTGRSHARDEDWNRRRHKAFIWIFRCPRCGFCGPQRAFRIFFWLGHGRGLKYILNIWIFNLNSCWFGGLS